MGIWDVLVLLLFDELICKLGAVFPNLINKILERFDPKLVDICNEIEARRLEAVGAEHMVEGSLELGFEGGLMPDFGIVLKMLIKSMRKCVANIHIINDLPINLI